MHPADIKAEMEKRGVTQVALAQELGVSQVTISKTIRKQMTSDRIMRRIAEVIGRHPAEVFECYLSPKRINSPRANG